MNTFILKNAYLYYNNEFVNKDIFVDNGKIVAIEDYIDKDVLSYDLKGKLVCHNFIDIHTHLREPGFEYKETIATGSLSALHGGYGTIVAMANTMPCMDNQVAIEDFITRVKKDACVNVYTYSAITKGLKGQELVDMETLSQYDIVLGFSDDGKGIQEKSMMEKAMKKCKEVGSIIVAHCEDESELCGGSLHDGRYAKEHGLVGINSASEYNHVKRDLDMVKDILNRYHICHISTKETVQFLNEAKKHGLKVSGEAAPHHLILTEDNIKDCHPNYKMNPPLRSEEDHQALINGLNNGTISVIATDHAPHSREEKNRPLDQSPFGIIGIQHAFCLMYTYLVKKGLVKLETILDALTTGPANVLGLNGEIVLGDIANLCIFDLNEKFVIKEEDIKSKSVNTPFIDVECYGKIKANIINGNLNILEEL